MIFNNVVEETPAECQLVWRLNEWLLYVARELVVPARTWP